MKKILLFLLTFLSTFVYSQEQYTKYLTAKITSITQTAATATTLNLRINMQDETNAFDGSSVDNTCVVVVYNVNDFSTYALPVTTVVTPSATQPVVTVNITGYSGLNGQLSGQVGVIYKKSGTTSLPPFVSGISSVLQQAINEHVVQKITADVLNAEEISSYVGNGVPAFTPTTNEPKLAQGLASPFPLYQWNGSAWTLVTGGGGLTAGVKLIATTADLATLSASVGDVVHTSSFSVAGDGGGAKYLISSSGTVDNIIIFAISGGLKAKLIADSDGSISPEQLGCKVDDNIDDSRRIQAALNQGYRKIVSYRKGVFSIKSRLIIPSNTAFKFSLFTEFKSDSSVTDLLLVNAGTSLDSNIVIDGGVWNRNNYGSLSANAAIGVFGTSNQTPSLHAIAFLNVRNLTFKNMKVINAPKYAINVGQFEDLLIDDIYFYTYSDGVHLNGNSKRAKISRLKGYTHDDFVALAGNDYPGYNISQGNIEDVIVEDIDKWGDNGNLVALFAGRDTATKQNYRIKNFTATDLKGKTANSSIVALTEYTPFEQTKGGVLENIKLSNIKAKHGGLNGILVSCDTVVNLVVDGYVSQQDTSPIYFSRGIVDVATFTNCTWNNVKYRSISLQDSAQVRVLNIDNMNMTLGNPQFNGSIPFLAINNLTAKVKASLVNISNSTFESTVADQGYIWGNLDSTTFKLSKVKFKGAYPCVDINKDENHVYIDDVDFSGNGRGILYNGTGTCYLYPRQHTTATIAINTFRTTSTGNFVVNGFYPRFIRQGGSGQLPLYSPIGDIYQVQNPNGSVSTWSGQNGETVNGLASIKIPGNTTMSFRKISSTAWETLTDYNKYFSTKGNSGLNTSGTPDFFGALDNTYVDMGSNGVRTMRLNANNTISVGATLPSPQAMVNIKSNYGGATYPDPILLEGLRQGSSTDSTITSANGVLKRMSFADVLKHGTITQTTAFNTSISVLTEQVVTFTVTGMTANGAAIVTWNGTKDSATIIHAPEVGTDFVKVRIYNSSNAATSTPNMNLILTVVKL